MKTVGLYGAIVLSLGVVAGAVALKAQTDHACPAGGVGTASGAATPCCPSTTAPSDKTTLTGATTSGELPACCASGSVAGEGSCSSGSCGNATLAGFGKEEGSLSGGCPYAGTMAAEGGCGGGSACEMGCPEGKDCDGQKKETSAEPTVVESKDGDAKPSTTAKAS